MYFQKELKFPAVISRLQNLMLPLMPDYHTLDYVVNTMMLIFISYTMSFRIKFFHFR